ncbi:hypothetical protein [Amycolatopsis sp. NPDC051903]|uniref:hypothetical protein n=1 Tax=Amycolatopsis sp. NPDC051903 TaxID=3363936 RepID=UPI0037BCF9FA
MTQRSARRFPDGGAFRLEIPSVEGPAPLRAVLEEADRYNVTIHRVSQGSGVAMLDDDQIADMLDQCAAAEVELCLFLGPRGTWDVGAGAGAPGAATGARVRGADQLRYSVDDAKRACDLGVRCLLVADEGVLWTLHTLRSKGELPPELLLKMSAITGPANPASFAVVAALGADSVNVPGDLTIEQLAELRRAAAAAIDFYVESPDGLGGFVRHHEAPEIVSAAAPVYLKFGLRNAPEIYPTGVHLETVAVASARERVRRAHLAVELLRRRELLSEMSPKGAVGAGPLPRFTEVGA